MFTIGTDTELFVKRKEEYINIQQLGIGGTKIKPELLKNGGNIQRDNVAIEFATDPASSKLELINSIGSALSDLKNLLPKDIDIDIVPSANFKEEYLEHEECKEAGCDPDYNAWDHGHRNYPPKDFAEQTLRSAAAHIHIGFVDGSGYTFLLDREGKMDVIKVMDVILGLMSVVLDDNKESAERKKLYGKAGCYRPTSYGVEYRTLSNFWIKDDRLIELVYESCKDILDLVSKNNHFDLIESIKDVVPETINNCDSGTANEILDFIGPRALREETWNLYKECEEKING